MLRADRRTTRAAVGLIAVGSVLLTACSEDAPQDLGTGAPEPTGPAGQLTLVSQGPVQTWDPQRMTSRQTAGLAGRLYLRGLTTYATGPDAASQRDLVGDLATDTGTASKNLKSWTFTLKKGVKWQDGSEITCADVRYGVSRAFDPNLGAGGYALTYLDIPKKPDGTSTYPGPFAKDGGGAKAKKLIEDAVRCKGREVTFRLSEPVASFAEIVSLPEFAPVKKSADDGKDATYAAFSSGPYQLEGPWKESSGGTWVRNPNWSAKTDSVREANPDRIVFREGVEPQEALAEITSGSEGRRTLALDSVPLALQPAMDDAKDTIKTVRVRGQLIDYLAPNHDRAPMKTKAARVALATATDRAGYLEALGGAAMGEPRWSLLPPTLPSSHDAILDEGPSGDPERAQKILKDAKITTPVAITVAYREGGELTQAMDRLKAGWEAGGFAVTLKPVTDDYFTAIASSGLAKDTDVFWANWGPDYPSASTVLPLLFDSRINLGEDSSGRDYGMVEDKKLNAAMDDAEGIASRSKRAAAWKKIDSGLVKDGSYIALTQGISTFAAGSEVTGLAGNEVYGGVVDLAVIGVSR